MNSFVFLQMLVNIIMTVVLIFASKVMNSGSLLTKRLKIVSFSRKKKYSGQVFNSFPVTKGGLYLGNWTRHDKAEIKT